MEISERGKQPLETAAGRFGFVCEGPWTTDEQESARARRRRRSRSSVCMLTRKREAGASLGEKLEAHRRSSFRGQGRGWAETDYVRRGTGRSSRQKVKRRATVLDQQLVHRGGESDE